MGTSRTSRNRSRTARVTAATAAGICAVLGLFAGPALADVPTLGTAPTVGGSTVQGQTLTVAVGTYLPVGVTLSHTWQSCNDAAGTGCTTVGADATSYATQASDVGRFIRVQETATDAATLAPNVLTTTSAAVGAITAAPVAPTVTVPTVTSSSGVAVGTVLTSSLVTATGTPTPTVTYQWQRCDAAVANCTSLGAAVVGPAVAPTYTTLAADAGFTIRMQVTATNTPGTATQTSVATGVITALPAATAQPTLAGAATLGTPQIVGTGTWSGNPTLTYRWQRCNGDACGDIVGAAQSVPYTLDVADVGFTVQAVVTATNAAGSVSASARSAVVTAGGTNFTPPVSVDTQATQPGDTFNVTAPAGTTPKATTPTPTGILQFTPFPVVRVKGVLTASGARVTLLSVTAPKGVGVKISCSGRGCPKAQTVSTTTRSVTRVTRFQRSLRAGVKITVKVFRTGYRGKYTTITIRKGTSPARRDGCLTATGRPMACQGG